MNDNEFSGDKVYEKNDKGNSFITPKRLVIIFGSIVAVLFIIFIINIIGTSRKDASSPTIYLNGNKVMTVEQGGNFADPGVQAVDNKDGVITSKVEATGTVNTAKDGTYHITYKVTDKAGNTATEERTVYVGDDAEGPSITITPNGSETVVKTQSVTVSATDLSEIKTLKYQWTTSTEEPSKTTFTEVFNNNSAIASPEAVTGNYYLWIYAEDGRGNVSVKSSNVFKLSKDATDNHDTATLVVNFDPLSNNIEAQSHSTRVTLSDNIKNAKYKWTTSTAAPTIADFETNFGNGDTISTPSGVTGDYYLWVYVVDETNNYRIVSSGVFKINKDITPADTTAPIVNFSPNGNTNKAAQQNSKVTVTDGSGVKTLMYQWAASSTAPSSSSFSLKFNSGDVLYSPTNVTGNYYLWIYAEDVKGNKAIVGSKVFNIGTTVVPPTDSTAPTISIATNGSGYAKSAATVVNVADATSGVKIAKYQWTTSTTVPAASAITNTFSSGNTISTPSGVTGNYYLWIYAEDNNGNNKIVGSNSFSLDNTAPTCSTSGYTSSWTNSNQTVKIACSDNNSKVATCNGTSGTSASVTYSSDTNKTYSYTVTDKAGNSGSCSAAIRLDKTPPTYKITGASTTWTNQSRKISISCSDSGSGVKDCWHEDTSSYSYTFKPASIFKDFSATATDKLGNTVTFNVNVYIDAMAPSSPTYTTGAGGAYVYFACGSEYGSDQSGIPSHCIIRCGPYSGSCSPTYVVGNNLALSVGVGQTACAQTLDNAGNESTKVCYTRN